jgi:alpha-tubulin suppressor-like RCC1 family protein
VASPVLPVLAAGSRHSLAAAADGTLWAWGWNGYGQLGDGTTTDRLTPVQVQRMWMADVVAIAGGTGTRGAR